MKKAAASTTGPSPRGALSNQPAHAARLKGLQAAAHVLEEGLRVPAAS